MGRDPAPTPSKWQEGRGSGSSRSTLIAICALAVCIFLWPALLTFSSADWPSPNQFPHPSPARNACGLVGAWFGYHFHYWVGDGAYPLLLFSTLAASMRLVRGAIGHPYERIFGLALVVAAISASAHLVAGPSATSLPVGHGGVMGFALGELLRHNVDRLGTLIVITASLLVGLVFVTQGWVLKLPMWVRHVGRASFGAVTAPGLPSNEGVTVEESRELLGPTASPTTRTARLERRGSGQPARRSATGKPAAGEDTLFDEDDVEPVARVKAGAAEPAASPTSDKAAPTNDAKAQPPSSGRSSSPNRHESRGSGQPKRPPAGPIVNFPSPRDAAAAEPYPRQIENWRLPALDLLHEPEYGFTKLQEEFVRSQAQVLERTLEEFRVEARVVEIDTGPVITMFELKLGAGIKVSQIAALANDIARALKAHAIRVVAPISGKNTVGIEVPNVDKERVRLRELINLAGKRASEMALPLFLGKDAGGAALVADLARMPHLLVAGTTGSGKSVCLNSIIISLLMTKRPDHVKMILIDPKMVELSQFKSVPHLMCPIVTDMPKAEKILEWAVTKMDERYELLAEARVKNITGYNALGAQELYKRLAPANELEKARIAVFLPYVVIIIDELADLMMTSAKEVEHHLSRLAQKSRAVGIHILVATQRPEAKIVTGLIKSNLPSRICFRVASRMDSRIVLDQNGGEVLLGQGDMLFLPPGSHKLLRAQGTFLDDGEVHAVLDDLASRAEPEFHPELIRLKTLGADADPSMRDPLFNQAVGIVQAAQRGSVSLLQRRLTIGYSRASRLIEQMAAAGIVGDYKGSQAREVVMTPEEWEAVREQVEADLEAGYEADLDASSHATDEPPWDDADARVGERQSV